MWGVQIYPDKIHSMTKLRMTNHRNTKQDLLTRRVADPVASVQEYIVNPKDPNYEIYYSINTSCPNCENRNYLAVQKGYLRPLNYRCDSCETLQPCEDINQFTPYPITMSDPLPPRAIRKHLIY